MNILALPQATFTPEDLLALPEDGKDYELVDGKLVERNMGMRSSRIGGELFGQLLDYNRAHRRGWVYPSEAGYQCFPDKPNKVRKPDVSFVRAERLPPDQEPEGHCLIPPDLAVEVVSPNDLLEEVLAKVEEYLAAGVALVWVVSPSTRTIWVYRKDGSGILLREKDDLMGEDVLPGFRCPVRALFLLPVDPPPSTPS